MTGVQTCALPICELGLGPLLYDYKVVWVGLGGLVMMVWCGVGWVGGLVVWYGVSWV